MTMYEPRGQIPPTTDLNQGDILRNVVRPALAPAVAVTRVLSRTRVEHPADPTALTRRDGELRSITRLNYLDYAVVLSASCDNARGTLPLILAPVKAFQLRGTTPTAKWREVSAAATGTASPKLFYLPSCPEHGLPRSEAELADMFVISHELLQRCTREAGTARVCGLTSAAVLHLQWAISVMFGRNPRGDDDWPSVEDYELQLAALEADIAIANERHEAEQVAALEQRRAQVQAILAARRTMEASNASRTSEGPAVVNAQTDQQEPEGEPVAGGASLGDPPDGSAGGP